jgi:hypothetical protein
MRIARTGLLVILFTLYSVPASLPTVQSANGCTGPHCAYLPAISKPDVIFVIRSGINGLKAPCFGRAFAIVENITSTPIRSIELAYIVQKPSETYTVTLSNGDMPLFPGQRDEFNGGLYDCSPFFDMSTKVILTAYTFDPQTSYYPLTNLRLSSQCRGFGDQTLQFELRNDTTFAFDMVHVYFDFGGGYSYGNDGFATTHETQLEPGATFSQTIDIDYTQYVSFPCYGAEASQRMHMSAQGHRAP